MQYGGVLWVSKNEGLLREFIGLPRPTPNVFEWGRRPRDQSKWSRSWNVRIGARRKKRDSLRLQTKQSLRVSFLSENSRRLWRCWRRKSRRVPEGGPDFLAVIFLAGSAQTLAGIASRAAGKSQKNFPAVPQMCAGKPFQQGIPDSHSLLEFSAPQPLRTQNVMRPNCCDLRNARPAAGIQNPEPQNSSQKLENTRGPTPNSL